MKIYPLKCAVGSTPQVCWLRVFRNTARRLVASLEKGGVSGEFMAALGELQIIGLKYLIFSHGIFKDPQTEQSSLWSYLGSFFFF